MEEENVEQTLTFDLAPHSIVLGDFEEPTMSDFINEMNTVKDYPLKDVYIDSHGGRLDYVTPLKKIIESHNAKLIACNNIYSSAFVVFFTARVEKEIMDGTIGLFHYSFPTEMTLLPNHRLRKPKGKFQKEHAKRVIPDMEYFKELLDIDQKMHKKLMKGKDLVYNTKELRKLLEKSEKIFGSIEK